MYLFSYLPNVVLGCVIPENKQKLYYFPLSEFKKHVNLIESKIISTVSGPTCSSHIINTQTNEILIYLYSFNEF